LDTSFFHLSQITRLTETDGQNSHRWTASAFYAARWKGK